VRAGVIPSAARMIKKSYSEKVNALPAKKDAPETKPCAGAFWSFPPC
jgi:hypothetical protein